MNHIEGVKRAFNKAAKTYDYNCLLQLTAARHLIEMLKSSLDSVGNVIDLGCGTGLVTEILKKEINIRKLYAIDIAEQCLSIAAKRLGDAVVKESSFDHVLFDDGMFDMVFSNMSFQWGLDIKKTINEASRLLKPQGVLAFSVLNDASFQQLISSVSRLGNHQFLNQLIQVKNIRDALHEYDIVEFHEKRYVKHFDSLFSLLKSIKNVGAAYTDKPSKTRLDKSDFMHINEHLVAEFSGKGIPLEYSVTFCLAQKK